jgi:hypothetical protein
VKLSSSYLMENNLINLELIFIYPPLLGPIIRGEFLFGGSIGTGEGLAFCNSGIGFCGPFMNGGGPFTPCDR